MITKTKVFNSRPRAGSAAGSWVAGQTLVELIVSILIFSIVMLGGMTFFTLGFNSFQRARRTYDVTIKCNAIIQSLYAMPWAGVAPEGLEQVVLTDNPHVQTDTGVDGIEYTYKTTITPNYGSYPELYEINVLVTWPQNPTGIDFDTFIASPTVTMQ